MFGADLSTRPHGGDAAVALCGERGLAGLEFTGSRGAAATAGSRRRVPPPGQFRWPRG
jgi:hypothetical protein